MPLIEIHCNEYLGNEAVEIEGKTEILALAWTMYLQMEVLLNLDKNKESLKEATEKKFQWVQEKVVSKNELNEFESHLCQTLLLFSSNLTTLNLSDASLVESTVETSSDFLEKGMNKIVNDSNFDKILR